MLSNGLGKSGHVLNERRTRDVYLAYVSLQAITVDLAHMIALWVSTLVRTFRISILPYS